MSANQHQGGSSNLSVGLPLESERYDTAIALPSVLYSDLSKLGGLNEE